MHKFQYIYALFLYCFLTLSKIVSEFTQLIAYNKAGITRQQGSTPRKEMTILILTKVAYLTVFLVLPLLVSDLNWWLIVLGFIVMHFVAGLIMSVVFQMAHLVEEVEQPVANEQNAIENEWTVHELETTANFSRRSGWFGWLIGGLNYQVEHHLFPNISHVHYRAISPIVEQTAKEFGVRYIENRTFFGAIYSHLRMLRTLGQPQAV